MGKSIPVALFHDAAAAVSHMAEVTKRTEEEVVADALNTYYWLLQQQASGRKIVSLNANGSLSREPEELVNFVADVGAAQKYLGA